MKSLPMLPWLWAGVLILLLVAAASGPEGLAGGPASMMLPWSNLITLTWRSLYVGALAGGVALVLAILPALTAARLESSGAGRVLLALTLLPALVPPICFAVAANRLAAPGWPLNGWPIYTISGTGIVLGWALSPLATGVLYAAWRRTTRRIEEAALLEAGPLRVLLRVVMPQAAKAAFVGYLVVFLIAVSDLGVAETLQGVAVLIREIYVQFGVYYNASGALRTGVLLLVPCLLLAGMLMVIGRWCFDSVEIEAEDRPGAPVLGRRLPIVRIAGWVAGIAPSVLLFGTLIATLHGSGESSFLAGARLAWRLAMPELVYTAWLAVVTAIVGTLLATFLGLELAKSRRPILGRFLMMACFLAPAPLLGVAFKRLLLPPPGDMPLLLLDGLAWLDGSAIPLVLAWLLRFVPLAALLMEWAMRRADPSLAEAARIEGAGIIGHARAWAFGALGPTAGAVALLLFALAFQESGSALLLVPPGTTTLSVRLLTLIHYAPGTQVSALCLLLGAPALLAAGLLMAAVILQRLFGRAATP